MCIEISKTLNDINPSFIKDISTQEKYKLNLEIPKSNQVKFGIKSLKYLGPKVGNSLSYHIKPSENLTIFKTLTKNRDGTHARYAKSETVHLRSYFLVPAFL